MAKPAGAAEKKEPVQQTAAAPVVAQTGKKGRPELVAGMCSGSGCKAKSHRFSFCDEHYEQFKFGLINKFGDFVPDYEKKWEHYQAYKAKLSKVA